LVELQPRVADHLVVIAVEAEIQKNTGEPLFSGMTKRAVEICLGGAVLRPGCLHDTSAPVW
jgi:hypothetical protein